jgi:hypothetical protein
MIKMRVVPRTLVVLTGLIASCRAVDQSGEPQSVDVEVDKAALVTKATPPNVFMTSDSFENTAEVVPPNVNAACPTGAISLNLGQNNFKGVAFRPLFDAVGAIDTTSLTSLNGFNSPATVDIGTDNQLVRLKDGSLLAERDIAIFSPATPAPPWAGEWIASAAGPIRQGNRGGIGLFRSTDCGKTWSLYSTVDFATLAGGIYGTPRPNGAAGDDVPCNKQLTYVAPTQPYNGMRRWHIGGEDRTELYADPFNGNVYLTTRIISGPFCTDTNDPRSHPDHDESLLLVSTDNALTWQVAQSALPNFSPLVMTSTPNGRLFVLTQTGPPQLFYSQPLAPMQIPALGTGVPVSFKDDTGADVPVSGPTSVDLFVQVGFPSISRISLDHTTSKVRIAYQAKGATGQQEMRVVRVEVRPDTTQPVIKNVAAVTADSATDHSAMYFNFNDPEYVDMPAGTQASSSMAYWIEAPQCRAGEGFPCNGLCFNPQIDPSNCGACGTACLAGQSCQSGVCTAAGCSAGFTACAVPGVVGTACANLQTDTRNCGGCGINCAFSETCSAGVCTPVPGKKDYAIRHMFFEGDCRTSPPLYLSVNNDHSPRTWKTQVRIGDYFSGASWWDGSLNYLAHWSEPNGLFFATTPTPFGTSQPDRHIFIQGRNQSDFSAYDTLARSDGWQTVDVGSDGFTTGEVQIDGVSHHTTLQSSWVQGFTAADFETHNTSLTAQGWSLDKVHSFVLAGGAVRVDALWTLQSRVSAHVQGVTLSAFEAQRDALGAQGYRLDYMQSFVTSDGSVLIDAVWHQQPGAWAYVQGFTVEDFETEDAAKIAAGWRTDEVQSFVLTDGSVRIDAVWHKGPEESFWAQGFTYPDFLDLEASKRCEGFELETLHSFLLPGNLVRVDAVWHRAAQGPTALCQDLTLPANTCNGAVTPQMVDNGSSDVTGGPLTMSLSTTGPFTAAATPVTLTVTNAAGISQTCSATVRIGGTPTFGSPYVVQLANGDVQYSITFNQKQAYVEAFVRQNGTQNISGNIVSSEVKNGDGTFTYKRVAPASQYHAGDVISARFYSHPPNSPGVFTPGPTSNIWLPNYVYGTGAECGPTCNTYIRALPNGDLRFSVTYPAVQAYAEAFVRRGTTQIAAGNIATNPVIGNADGTFTYSRVLPASNFHTGDQVTVRFYSYVQGGQGVFVPGPTSSTWSATYVYGTSAPPSCTTPH